jgi:hypothetical protein
MAAKASRDSPPSIFGWKMRAKLAANSGTAKDKPSA